ncbi:XdhC family protein [Tenacibaculum amylolyticum]|uniref:XdhC family protein n=1 Tax=Tenacibaculum amylolyticum TaxID=104269 RepID=UPI00389629B3
MTHEFVDIVKKAIVNQQNGIQNVLATVVYLEGSSYRKPGVRMLISESGEMIGAVSGGCVEKEVKSRAQSVFKEGKAKVITYDGRYRLGCEGILYILIEPFSITDNCVKDFEEVLQNRTSFTIKSFFVKEDNAEGNFGSLLSFSGGKEYVFNNTFLKPATQNLEIFTQELQPRTKLLIIGGEHDAVKLCAMASLLGWEIDVITSIKDPKEISDFPGATTVQAQAPELAELIIDSDTVVVLMTHNYVQDLKFLLKLIEQQPQYIGILGSSKRRDQLENDLFYYRENLTDEMLESIYSPAGLNIGAITPEEIALSILSEILSVIRNKEPFSLRNIKGKIHIE